MSATPSAGLNSDFVEAAAEAVKSPGAVLEERATWNPEDFGREQIRGLVRRLFFSSRIPPVRQVVFSAAEPHTDVAGICEKVGWALALETSGSIAIVGSEPQVPAADWRNRS